MGWKWQTWKRWETVSGAALVVAAAGWLGVVTLWPERDEPLYAGVAEELESRGAVVERDLAVLYSNSLGYAQEPVESRLEVYRTTNAAGELAWVVGTNAVGIVPSRSWWVGITDDSLSGVIRRSWNRTGVNTRRWADLWPAGVGAFEDEAQGAWDAELMASGDNRWMDLDWWQSNVTAGASEWGRWDWNTNGAAAPLRLSTGMYARVWRALSAQRWTVERAWDGEKQVSLWWRGTSQLYVAAVDWPTLVADAAADLAAQDEPATWMGPLPGSASEQWAWVTNGEVAVKEHFTTVEWKGNGGGFYYADMREYLNGEELRTYVMATGLARTVWSVGGLWHEDDAGGWDTNLFWHGLAGEADREKWLVLESAPVNEGRRDRHGMRIWEWDGRMDGRLLGFGGAITNAQMGWQKSSYGYWVADWGFESGTNRVYGGW